MLLKGKLTEFFFVIDRESSIFNEIIFFYLDIEDKPLKIRIYDFQFYYYNSFVHDLMFFLCTSVCTNDLAQNFTLFLKHYQEQFLLTLKQVNCPLDEYSFEK